LFKKVLDTNIGNLVNLDKVIERFGSMMELVMYKKVHFNKERRLCLL